MWRRQPPKYFEYMDPREIKANLRAAIAQRLERMTEKDRAAESRSLCRRILEALPEEPSVICAFYPLKDETDIRPLLQEIIAHGHALSLPRKEGNHFVFRRVDSVEGLSQDDFRVPAPAADAPLLKAEECTLALIPARAYDRKGNRLGRGNGGYDHWIREQRKQNANTQFWGVALECQIVQEIPMEAHDERVDGIITARGFSRT